MNRPGNMERPTMPPIRERDAGHVCACVLPDADDCPNWVDSPDSPFCDDCEESGHPELLRISGAGPHATRREK